jgi:hypothetical protein
VGRCVQYVRSKFVAGEQFRDINDCRERAEHWYGQTAGIRIHGTTRMRPAVVFSAEKHAALAPVPEAVFDIPAWTHPGRAAITVPSSMTKDRQIANRIS